MQGSWRSAFEGTYPAPFTLANGSVISVAMMRMQTDSLELLFLDGCYCAVRLPFKVPSLLRPLEPGVVEVTVLLFARVAVSA